jgi:hypothetical protein
MFRVLLGRNAAVVEIPIPRLYSAIRVGRRICEINSLTNNRISWRILEISSRRMILILAILFLL